MMFKKGDMVKITKPKNTKEHPVWIDEMNRYDGKVVTLELPVYDGVKLWSMCEYNFSTKWLELVNNPNDAYDYAMGIV